MKANAEAVPFLDLKAAYHELKCEIDTAISRSLESGWYIGGAGVESFEAEFAEYVEAAFCVSVGNGLDALSLALRAVGVQSGDEVIVPSHTFIASWLAVSQLGAVPIPVECSADTFTINPSLIERAITAKTKAIIPVHLYGCPADLDPILELARQYGLKVVEDAAQSHGARYKGRRLGGHSDATAWSFYPGKNLGAFGDAGAVTTCDSSVADRVQMLRNYGSKVKYVNDELGVNSRMDPLHAAVLSVKLRSLDTWNKRRKVVAERYLEGLSMLDLIVPMVPEWAEPVWHLFVIRCSRRSEIQKELLDSGVGTLIHYPIPPHLQTAYRYLGISAGRLPVAEMLANEVLSLPMGPHLGESGVEKAIYEMQHAVKKASSR